MNHTRNPLTADCPRCSHVADCPVYRKPPRDEICKYFAHRALGAESKTYSRRRMIADGLIEDTP